MMSFFSSGRLETCPLVDETTIVALQKVAYHLTTSGLVTQAEEDHNLPTWEDWIKVSAKRRAILALYCFECVFTVMSGLPTFPCDELMPLPAPAGKVLWQSRDKEQWECAYKQWLTNWKDGPFLMSDLMRRPRTEAETEKLDRWLGEVDEFGMMIMTVVNSAHR